MIADVPSPEPVGAGALLTAQTLAVRLDCSERHVYRLAARGVLPIPLRLGALVRWRSTDIDDWIGAGCPVLRAMPTESSHPRKGVRR